jgi:hypothetical protein
MKVKGQKNQLAMLASRAAGASAADFSSLSPGSSAFLLLHL